MSKKTDFIDFVNAHVDWSDAPETAMSYWMALQRTEEKEKPLFTDNGKMILKYFQDNPDVDMVKAKDIGDALMISSRMASGAMRKLVTDGFIEKNGKDPVLYSITEKGKNIAID